MKTILRISSVALVLLASSDPSLAAPVLADQPALTLNIELRDGSRLIGRNIDATIQFHSELLGNLKLDAQALRSIDCVKTNAATLTTINGDRLAVQFSSPALRVTTGFGRVALPVAQIRKVQFSTAGGTGQLPSGLVALWSAEGDGRDSVGGNTATLTDITFAEGKVGQAFVFNGTSSYITIPENPALDVGAGDGFTVTAWIKPAKVNGIYIVVEWAEYLSVFEIGKTPSDQGVLIASVFDSDRNNHFLHAGPGTIVANVFQHLALTYDKASGLGTLYVNGTVVAQSHLGSYVPLTKGGLRLGYRPSNPGDWTYDRYFSGLMDELAVYNRALSASEISAICLDQNNGEPLPSPPVRPNQPFNGSFRSGVDE
jgi:hypothetical protein